MTIRLVTLGRLAVYRDAVERPALRSQHIPCALLVYQGVQRQASREELMALLWPRRSPEQARHALSQTLYRLRRELGDEWVESHARELRTTSHVEVDVHDFLGAVDRMEWDRAVEQYTGSFLAGVYLVESNPFEMWVDQIRSRCETAYAQANQRFIAARLGAGDVETALDAARRWVALDPLAERAQARLIELLAVSGHRLKALRQFERYEALLADELDVEPLPETRDLVRRIRAGGIGPAGTLDIGMPASVGARSGRWSGEADTPGSRARRTVGAQKGDGEEPAAAGSTGTEARAHAHPPPVARQDEAPGSPAVRRLAWALTFLALLSIVALLIGRGARSPPLPSADEPGVAVLPFAPTVADSALWRLGRDLVVTVSTNLDGLGGIRAIDPSAILAHTAEERNLTERRARELVGMLGATRFVHGRLIRSGDRVRLDFGVFNTESGEARRSSVQAPLGDLMAITDSVTWAIVQQLWVAGEPPTPSLGAVTTRSVRALDAFLEGERSFVAGRWMPAARAFRRAFEIDSTFWLARWRYAFAATWIGASVDSAVIRAYVRHRFELPERERSLIEVGLAEGLTERLALGRRITERFPDYWPAWLEAGDDLMRLGPFLGYEVAEARGYFDRATDLNMMLVPAWLRLVHLHLLDYDSAAVASAIDTLDRLGAWEALEEGYGFDQGAGIVMLDQIKRAGAAEPSVRDAYLRSARAVAGLFGAENALGRLLVHGLPAAEVEMIDRLRRRGAGVPLIRESHRVEALAWVARGAWDSAVVAADRFAERGATGPAGLLPYRLAVLGAWVGALEADDARERRDTAVRSARRLAPWGDAELAWLDGMLAVATDDGAALRDAIRTARDGGAESAPALVRALQAFELGLRGDVVAAVRELTELEWERAERPLRHRKWHPYLTAVNRLAAGRWLAGTGSPKEGERILRFHEALNAGETQPYLVGAALASLALFERAKIAERTEDPSSAARYYRLFVQRYDRPVARHRPMVRAARSALRRLKEALPDADRAPSAVDEVSVPEPPSASGGGSGPGGTVAAAPALRAACIAWTGARSRSADRRGDAGPASVASEPANRWSSPPWSVGVPDVSPDDGRMAGSGRSRWLRLRDRGRGADASVPCPAPGFGHSRHGSSGAGEWDGGLTSGGRRVVLADHATLPARRPPPGIPFQNRRIPQ